MKNQLKKNLIPLLILFVVAAYAIYFYSSISREDFPGEHEYRIGNDLLEKNELEKALTHFNKALAENNKLDAAYLGRGITLMYMNRLKESKKSFNRAVEINSAFAEAFANRGILNDKMGKYKDALKDYKMALKLKPKLAEGPGWLWRFLRNISEKPPTILDRARYIEFELKKPESERKLKLKKKDDAQLMYTPGKSL
jgi:tetratricopeptide (TPR) repeat protein